MQQGDGDRAVETIDEARGIARSYALVANVSEERAEAAAESWFDAGKDDGASRRDDLLGYLKRHIAC